MIDEMIDDDGIQGWNVLLQLEFADEEVDVLVDREALDVDLVRGELHEEAAKGGKDVDRGRTGARLVLEDEAMHDVVVVVHQTLLARLVKHSVVQLRVQRKRLGKRKLELVSLLQRIQVHVDVKHKLRLVALVRRTFYPRHCVCVESMR